MNRLFQVLVSLAMVILWGMTPAWAQPGGGGGGGPGGGYGRMFNPATVETLSGEVTKVERFTAGRGMGQGVHLTLKTATETLDVHLGPSWYLEQQGFTVATGNKLDITGSRITFQGKPAIIASELKKGNQVLILRNAQGVPAWAGAGRGWR